MIITVTIIEPLRQFYVARPCSEIAWLYEGSERNTKTFYPECASYFNGTDPEKYVAVNLNFNGRKEQIGASLGESFVMALGLALTLHAVGIEIYVRLSSQQSILSSANVLQSSD
jgi:hypothetical protein